MKMQSIFVLSVVLAVLSTAALAAPIYGTPAPMSGIRSVGSGISTTDTDDWGDVTLEWNIVDNQNDTRTWTYTLTGFDKPDVSNFTIDITDDAVDNDGFLDENAVTDFLFNGSPSSAIDTGDKSGIAGAVKFDIGDEGTLTYTFTSNRHAIYGDFYIKGGLESAQNTGFGDRTSENATWYIATPDSPLPEPASMLVVMIGATGLLIRRKR